MMEILVLIAVFGGIGFLVKMTFFPGAKKEKPAVDKRVPIANTFAEPLPEVPTKKIKCATTPLADSKALVGGTVESFGIGAGAVNLFYDED